MFLFNEEFSNKMDLLRQNWIDSLRPKIPSSHLWKFVKFQRDLVVFYAPIFLFSPWIVDIRVIIQNGYHKPDGGKYKNNARIIGKTPNDKTRKQFRSRPKFNENSWWYTLCILKTDLKAKWQRWFSNGLVGK